MELFPAADEDQFEYIKRIIDRCDYYLVIVAGRYGSVASDGLSFTEKEFDYAKARGLKATALLHKNPETLPRNKCETGAGQLKRLEAFRSKLKRGRMVDFWDNKDDLCTKAVIAINQSVNLFPGLGWIRSDNAIDPKILQDLERLRSENEKLKKAISQSLNTLEVQFDPTIKGPDSKVKIEVIRTARRPTGKDRDFPISVNTTFAAIFVMIYEDLLHESSEEMISRALGGALYPADKLPSERQREKLIESFECNDDDLLSIRTQLEALGLILAKPKPHLRKEYIVWFLTDLGRRYYSHQTALRPKTIG